MTENRRVTGLAPILIMAAFFFILLVGGGGGALLLIMLMTGGEAFSTNELLVVLGTILGLGCVSVFIVFAVVFGMRFMSQSGVTRRLDPAFTPLGMTGAVAGLGTSGTREYKGLVNGRTVTARYQRQYMSRYRGSSIRTTRYAGSTLNVTVEMPTVKTRLGVGRRNALGGAVGHLFKREPIRFDDPTLEDLMVYALDDNWARELMGNEYAVSLIRALTRDLTSGSLASLNVQPGALVVRIAPIPETDITPPWAQELVQSAVELAEIVEDLPAPYETAEATGLERTAREGGSKMTVYGMLIAFGLIVGFAVLGVVGAGLCFLAVYLADML